jgi:hypothetical protein
VKKLSLGTAPSGVFNIDFDTIHGHSFVRLSFAGPTEGIKRRSGG